MSIPGKVLNRVLLKLKREVIDPKIWDLRQCGQRDALKTDDIVHCGIPEKIIALLVCNYQDMSCMPRIVHNGQLSDNVEVKSGVRQRCLLSPFLLLLVLE